MLENQSPEDMIQQYWVEIASINKACNDTLFPSKELTARYIHTGEYISRLHDLLPILHSWNDRLDKSKGIENLLDLPTPLLIIQSGQVPEDSAVD